MELGGFLQRLNHRWREPGHRLDRPLDPFGRFHQGIEIVTVHLDRDLGVDARDHVADEMGERLLDFDRHARHLAAEFVEQLFDDLLAVAAGVGVHGEDVFARVDRCRMFVELRTARPPHE